MQVDHMDRTTHERVAEKGAVRVLAGQEFAPLTLLGMQSWLDHRAFGNSVLWYAQNRYCSMQVLRLVEAAWQ